MPDSKRTKQHQDDQGAKRDPQKGIPTKPEADRDDAERPEQRGGLPPKEGDEREGNDLDDVSGVISDDEEEDEDEDQEAGDDDRITQRTRQQPARDDKL